MVFHDFAAVAVKLRKPPPAGQGQQGDAGTTAITGAGDRQPAGSPPSSVSSSAISSARLPRAECRTVKDVEQVAADRTATENTPGMDVSSNEATVAEVGLGLILDIVQNCPIIRA